MSNEDGNPSSGMLGILTKPSNTLANWYLWLGLLGLLLAVLNLAGIIHPSYRVSWGGMFTFEATNNAFGDKDTAPAFVVSDAVFILFCSSLVYLGARSLIGDSNFGDWLTSLLTNDWYNNLIDPENGGWGLLLGTWAMVVSILFYFFWGIMYMAWIDPGVYSIAISLMASGLVLRMLTTIEED
tara:strand:- start:153 stop:701 length:549 start_codon:yes stop_codon:yes gene_type:complete